jgi:NADPH:quinone reductase-like Zn-dependent oxidoreductase
MKVIQVNNPDQGPVLILAELEKPEPGLGEILIQVHAAGVTPNRIALVYHDTYEIRNSAHARCPRARIFGSHHGDRQRCPGLRDWRRGLWHERLVR